MICYYCGADPDQPSRPCPAHGVLLLDEEDVRQLAQEAATAAGRDRA